MNRFGQLLFFALAVTPLVASAQKPKFIRVNGTEIRGHVVGVGRGFLLVKSLGGQPWNVSVAKAVHVRVTGKASVEALVPGVFVRFTANVDKRQSRVVEPVSQLTVFVPHRNRPDCIPGAQPSDEQDSATDPAPAAKPDPLPSLPRVPRGSAKPSERTAKTTGGESFDIRAQIVSFKKGKLVVAVQSPYLKPKLTLELADDVAVDFDLADVTLAKPGDEIMVRGLSIVVGKAEAYTVVIRRPDGQAVAGKGQAAPSPDQQPDQRRAPDDSVTTSSDEADHPAPLE